MVASKQLKRVWTGVLMATMAACIGAARAELISIDTAGVYVISSYSTRTGDKLVDGSGLASGLHDANANNMWLSGNGGKAGHVIFDLGAVYSVTNIHIWNYNESVSETDRCVSNLVVKYGTNMTFGFDSSFESTLTEISELSKASGGADEPTQEFDSFSPFNARYVLFDIQGNFGDPGYSGLSEVQFYGTFVDAGAAIPSEITGVTVESYSTQDSTRPASATLDNTGLDSLGHHTIDPKKMWMSNNEELPEVVYDLGAIYDVELIEVWNYNESPTLSNRGINGVSIAGSQDGSTFSPIASTNFTQAPGNSTNDFSQTIPLTVTARYIRLDVTSDHGGDNRTGLSEIKFYGTLGGDDIDPDLAELFPVDGAMGVGVNTYLEIIFDEAITNVSGNITIKKTSDDSVVEAFDVASSGQLTWDYPNWSILIEPTVDLETKTGYYVEIDATAIDDRAGNSFAGISGSGTWRFTTAGALITNTTVEAFISENSGRVAVDAINGTGLPGDVPTLFGAHNTAPGDMWMTDAENFGYIVIDLGENYVLDTIHVWNYNETPTTYRSMKDVQISVSSTGDTNDLVKVTTDGTGDTDNGSGDFLFPRAPGTSDYLGFNVDLTSLTDASLLESVRLVKIENTSIYGGSLTGLAEIHFGGAAWQPPDGTIFRFK